MYMNEAAIEPSAVLTKWLTQHPTADPSGSATKWFDQLFPTAYDLLASQPAVVPCTRFGLLECVLSQLSAGISSRKDAMLGLAKGLGFTLEPAQRQQFVSQLFR
jgi:hypothetical protein